MELMDLTEFKVYRELMHLRESLEFDGIFGVYSV